MVWESSQGASKEHPYEGFHGTPVWVKTLMMAEHWLEEPIYVFLLGKPWDPPE